MDKVKAFENLEEQLGNFLDREIGGIRSFKRVPYEVLSKVKEWIDEDPGGWNACPGNECIFSFMEKWTAEGIAITAHGFFISPNRPDCALVIEGLEVELPTSDDFLDEWIEKFHKAEKFSRKYFWYD